MAAAAQDAIVPYSKLTSPGWQWCTQRAETWLSGAPEQAYGADAIAGGMRCKQMCCLIAQPNRWTVKICCSSLLHIRNHGQAQGVVHTTGGY